jgi:hypothetical protein
LTSAVRPRHAAADPQIVELVAETVGEDADFEEGLLGFCVAVEMSSLS